MCLSCVSMGYPWEEIWTLTDTYGTVFVVLNEQLRAIMVSGGIYVGAAEAGHILYPGQFLCT